MNKDKIITLVLGASLLVAPFSVLAADLQDQTYTLGQQALGGTIIYVTAAGNHGLVAANTNQGRNGGGSLWGASNEVTIPANFDRSGQAYTDWHLPSLHELTVMCNNKQLFPAGAAPDAGSYWSSTILGQRIISGSVYSSAYQMDMKKCESDVYLDGSGAYIRAVRTF